MQGSNNRAIVVETFSVEVIKPSELVTLLLVGGSRSIKEVLNLT